MPGPSGSSQRGKDVIELSSDDDEYSAQPVGSSGFARRSYREIDGIVHISESPSPASQSVLAPPAWNSRTVPGTQSPVSASSKAVAASHYSTPSRVDEAAMSVREPHIKTSPSALKSWREKTPEAASPIRNATPTVESDSEGSENQDFARSLRTSSGTPSKSSQAQRQGKSPNSTSNTDSPLPNRFKKESQWSKRTQLILEDDLISSLRKFKRTMDNDHREVTYWRLHDAKLAIEDTPPSEFDETTDPFVSLTSVLYKPGDPLPKGCVREQVKNWSINKAGKGPKHPKVISLVATTFNDGIRRVPNYQSHTNVRRNILTADDENLKYIPYMGEQPKDDKHDQLMQELNDQYVTARTEDIQDFERAAKLRIWLTSWLETLNIGLDQQTLKHYVLTLEGIETKLRVKATELRTLRAYASYPLDQDTIAVSEMFYAAFEEVFDIGLEKVVLPKDQLKEMMEIAAKKTLRSSPTKLNNDVQNRLGTYVELTCLICGVVDCPTHGEFEDQELGDQDSEEEQSPRFSSSQRLAETHHEQFYQRQHSDLALPYEDTLARYISQKQTRPKEPPLRDIGPCSDLCYITNEYAGRDFELDPSVLAAIPEMLITFTDPKYRSCHIAFSFAVACWQVHAEVVKYLEANPDPITGEATDTDASRIKRPEWYDNKKKSLKGDWKDLTTAHLHQTRHNSNSCGHDGPCTKACPCYARNILCERFCGCADDCPRRFTGCSCHNAGINCVSEHCICIAMNRECGPECISCGAIARIDPVNKHHDALFTAGCQNIALQRGVFKKLVMGESQLEGTGFGVYLIEAAKKGEFLSEYTGEVISHAEAERRGIIYDRKLMSFLFDLNASYVIDAAKMGNKTRFINHASLEKEGLNCEAKIVLVNGEHRIKFIALRDIGAGEELLFNYGRKFAEKHGLTVKLPSAKEGNKGVLVGEEALDALDGVTTRTKIARGQMKAVRGRGGGRGGGKAASKSAPKPKGVKEVQEEDVETEPSQESSTQQNLDLQEDDEDEDYGSSMEEKVADDDEEGEDDEDLKPKRQSRRPTRYTR